MLDLKTLFMTLAIITSFVSFSLFFYGKSSRTYPGFNYWAFSTFSASIGYVAMFFRGSLPVWISILLVNGLAVLSGLSRLDGIMRFTRGQALGKIFYTLPLTAVAFAAYFHFAVDSITIRTAALTGWICLFSWAIAVLFIKSAKEETKLLYYTAATINIIYGFSMLVRLLLNVRASGAGLLVTSSLNSIIFVSIMVYEIWLGQLIMMMNNQRMEQDLRHNEEELKVNIDSLRTAMSEVKVLKGLLPICATCKKIRDDKGYWKQLEWYINENSEAKFTHGICPECADKLLKEFEDYQTSKD